MIILYLYVQCSCGIVDRGQESTDERRVARVGKVGVKEVMWSRETWWDE